VSAEVSRWLVKDEVLDRLTMSLVPGKRSRLESIYTDNNSSIGPL